MALNLIADVNSFSASSHPSEIIEIPGAGMAFKALVAEAGIQTKLITITLGGVRTDHVINKNFNSDLKELTHFKDSSGQDWVYFSGSDGITGTELYRLKFGTNEINRVKDINPNGDSAPADFTVVGDALYFTAWNPATGRELWKTKGFAYNTAIVEDIIPGTPSSSPEELTTFGNLLYFVANDEIHGRELWRSNGTLAGTFIVKDIWSSIYNSNPVDLTVAGDRLYFSATNLTYGREVWQSNGLGSGTKLLKDIRPIGSSNPEELTALNDELFFTAFTPEKGRELYRYEPDVLNDTFLVKDIYPGAQSSLPTELTAVGGAIYFAASAPVTGRELWKSYGVGFNTQLVRDINPDTSSTPSELVNVNGRLYFQAFTTTHGVELWKSDGLSQNTLLVKNINPLEQGSYPNNLASVNGKLVFAAGNSAYGTELWTSAGTAATTTVNDVWNATISSDPRDLKSIGNSVYFVASNSEGTNLFVLNGTSLTALTSALQNFNFLPIDNRSCVVGDTLYFVLRNDPNGPVDQKIQVWKTNGTVASTTMLKEISGGIGSMFASDGKLYFTVAGNNGTFQLWTSSGTVAGTSQLESNTNFTGITEFIDVNGRLFFSAEVDDGPERLWRSEGTNATTVEIANLESPRGMVAKGSQIYFSAKNGTVQNFYRINGTNAPVVIMAGLVCGSEPGININGTMYFSAKLETGTDGYQLWKSDGTAVGTLQLKKINPVLPSLPNKFVNVNGKLFFTADAGGTSGRELWISDGTAAGTKQVKALTNGQIDPQILPLAVFKNELYFKAYDGTEWAIWKSNGTAAGTSKVDAINDRFLNVGELNESRFSSAGNGLYISGYDPDFGQELFVYKT